MFVKEVWLSKTIHWELLSFVTPLIIVFKVTQTNHTHIPTHWRAQITSYLSYTDNQQKKNIQANWITTTTIIKGEKLDRLPSFQYPSWSQLLEKKYSTKKSKVHGLTKFLFRKQLRKKISVIKWNSEKLINIPLPRQRTFELLYFIMK